METSVSRYGGVLGVHNHSESMGATAAVGVIRSTASGFRLSRAVRAAWHALSLSSQKPWSIATTKDWAKNILEEAKEEAAPAAKTPEEEDVEERRLLALGADQADKLGIKPRDADRLVND